MNSRKKLFKIKIKKTFLELALLFVKTLAVFGSFLISFMIFLAQPLKLAGRFVFYKVVVKLYCYYLSLIKKLGWNRNKKGFLSFLFNEKIVHVAVMVITFSVVLVNIAPFTNAQSTLESRREAIVYQLVQSEFGEFEEEEELIEESLNKETLDSHVNLQKKYRQESLALKDDSSRGRGGESFTSATATSEQAEGLEEAQNLDDSLKDRKEVLEYTVQTGDTVSTIADKFGISVNTILWENGLSAYDLIRPGDELVILPISGVRHEVDRGESLSYIASKYDISKSKIIEANNISDPGRLSVGEKLLIPGGEKQDDSSSSSQSVSSGRTSGQSAISAVKDVVQSPRTSQVSSNKMHWPTTGHRITQYYSWRHKGLDVADNIGTPLFASDAGVIEFVGWSRGYGNNIVIDHGGGKKTRYAHMHRFYVSRGERVAKGQTLGEMGNTGWSTGPHVHFEVVINGRRQNPLNYIK